MYMYLNIYTFEKYLVGMIKIDVPHDYDIGANTDSRFFQEKPIPEICLMEKTPKKKRKGILFTENRKQNKKGDNYFQKMYKQTKKKIYVGMFIRKLRQGIPLHQKFSHQLCESQNDKYYGAMKRFRWNINLEALFMCLIILQVWISSLVTTLRITFDEVRYSTRYMNTFFVLLGICEILYHIFVKSKIKTPKTKRNLDYVKQGFYQYLQSGWLVFDIMVIAIFFVNMIIFEEVLGYFELIVLIKIKQTSEKMRYLQIIFIKNNFKEQYWELIKVFIFNFLFAHFLAIILALLGHSENSWIKHYNFQETWYIVYVWAYYWATNIMLTVGFGDITATNPEQALCLIFIQTLSCIVLAYNINSIGNIIQKITSYEQQKSSNLKIFTQMQQEEGVTDDVKVKITDFITQSAELKKKFNVAEEEQFLQKLPKSFYEQFKIESTYKIFQNIPFFRNFNVKKLQQLSIKMEKKLSHPEEVLIQSHTVPKILIFNNGTLSLHMKCTGVRSDGREVQIIKAKQSQYKLVSQYFLINKPINYEIKCKDYSIMYSINKQELIDILSSNPYCYEYYCMSKDRDRFNPNDLEVQICQLCSSSYHKAYHTFFDCPKLHYQPLRQIVIQKTLKNPAKLMKYRGFRKSRRILMNPLIIYAELEDMFNATYFKDKATRKKIMSSRKLLQGEFMSQFNCEGEEEEFTKNFIELAEKKANFLLSLSKQISKESKDSMEDIQIVWRKIGEEIGEQLKQELIKTVAFPSQKQGQIFWDLGCDNAYNFPFYFQKNNPDRLCQKFNKKGRINIKM